MSWSVPSAQKAVFTSVTTRAAVYPRASCVMESATAWMVETKQTVVKYHDIREGERQGVP